MFNSANQTVFILGAGASWHYGYPTGETLVTRVIEKAGIAAQFFEHSLSYQNSLRPDYITEGHGFDVDWPLRWKKAHDVCVKLKAGLEQVKPLVIDYYLGWNPDLQNIGRLLIAWVILECEHLSRSRNLNRHVSEQGQDDWCRFVIHQLAMRCKESKDLLRNHVSFVTFNYDVSLERALRNGLKHIQMFDEKDVVKFLGGSRIVHVYGKVREDGVESTQVDWAAQHQDLVYFDQALKFDPGHDRMRNEALTRLKIFQTAMKQILDVAYVASKGLRVIDPHDKGADDTEIMMARTAIAHAKRIVILGYGFDEHNSSRLNLREHLAGDTVPQRQVQVSFTNYQDINQINKRASNLFAGHRRAFPPGGAIVDRYEKSTRNTYDALAMDFDLAD